MRRWTGFSPYRERRVMLEQQSRSWHSRDKIAASHRRYRYDAPDRFPYDTSWGKPICKRMIRCPEDGVKSQDVIGFEEFARERDIAPSPSRNLGLYRQEDMARVERRQQNAGCQCLHPVGNRTVGLASKTPFTLQFGTDYPSCGILIAMLKSNRQVTD